MELLIEKNYDGAINKLKTFNWQKVINIIPNLEDLNDAQWRFLKGFIIEIATEKSSNNELTYVALPHKDFDWPSENLTVELKSLTSKNFYKKDGQLKPNFSIKLNNSNGTNNKTTLSEDNVSDILVIVGQDGVFCVKKNTVLKNAIKTGDGFLLKLNKFDLISVTCQLKATTTKTLDFRKIITDAICQHL